MNKQQLLVQILNKPKKLSQEQENAVLSDARYLKIIAGAGAGKTETLTRKIMYLLLCKGADPSSIASR